ncbi:hypothetical protein [Clostridium tagluense]|uniref:Uncharacterized protein n=1 Tax=Clostridium tagluense TaxID=360422 RepID=A0A401UM38_9CLOT|nr:hypothetical protein [Clostridium tagluense]GCD10600.1 hypothetical protein Ctaglu_22230 [Clostridium tagluense]
MYPQNIDKFIEKLNKLENNIYVLEEEVTIANGVYEGELEHDNVSLPSISVYTGSKLTGNKIENFILSTPSKTPWKKEIKIFSNMDKVYITYQTQGDTVEAEDINKLQESVVNTQTEAISYKSNNNLEVGNLKVRATNLENNKSEKTYVDTELNKRYLKEQVFTREEVLQKIKDVIGVAPDALDTLQEIAKSLNNDADFAGTITKQLTTKVDKAVGKQLSTEDYSTLEKQKLAGIEQGANKYIHPVSHSADIIVDNENRRFVKDADKNNWNTVAEKSDKSHKHNLNDLSEKSYNSLSDKPTVLPASGGNSDTVGGKTFNWNGKEGQPPWLWGGNDSTNMYVYNPNNFNVNSAKNSDTVGGKYSSDFMPKGPITWNNLKGV